MDPITIVSAICAMIVGNVGYLLGRWVECRKHYRQRYDTLKQMEKLETRVAELSSPVKSASHRSASIDHGFTTGMTLGAGLSESSGSGSSDSGGSSW